jgi:hypothetical protein
MFLLLVEEQLIQTLAQTAHKGFTPLTLVNGT